MRFCRFDHYFPASSLDCTANNININTKKKIIQKNLPQEQSGEAASVRQRVTFAGCVFNHCVFSQHEIKRNKKPLHAAADTPVTEENFILHEKWANVMSTRDTRANHCATVSGRGAMDLGTHKQTEKKVSAEYAACVLYLNKTRQNDDEYHSNPLNVTYTHTLRNTRNRPSFLLTTCNKSKNDSPHI